MGLPKKRNSLNKRVKKNKKRKSKLNNRRKSKKGGASRERDTSTGRGNTSSKEGFQAYMDSYFPQMQARQAEARQAKARQATDRLKREELESLIEQLNDSGITIIKDGEDVSALYNTLKTEHIKQVGDPVFKQTNDLTEISEYFINTTHHTETDQKRFPKSAEILEKIMDAPIDTQRKINLLTQFFTIFLVPA